MKILITGGAGSIGKELAFSLNTKGYEVSSFDIPQANFSGLEECGIHCIKGDIVDSKCVSDAVAEQDIIIHLAGILPPASEMMPEKATAVNLKGTKNLVDAIVENGNRARLIFSSTVAVYGDTRELDPYLGIETRHSPNSIYSSNKSDSEKYILDSGISYTILRISAVFLAALMDPPQWPCIKNQRVEFVFRDDVVTAILSSVESDAAVDRIFNIAGGPSWQMIGSEFVEAFFDTLDIPAEDAEYPEKPLYSDWYDTAESQEILSYQNTSFNAYLETLKKAIEQELA